MIQLDLGAALLAFLAAMGVPSAIMGLLIWRLERRIEDKDSDRETRAAAQQKLILLLVQSTRASISLGEATAHALQRGHTNGDTEEALAFAAEVKREQKAFLENQGIHNILDE